MRWPWQRDEGPASPVARNDPAAAPSPMGWAFLPPLQRTLATGIETITRPTEFAHELPAWRNPSFNAPLTHLVSDAAPSGVIGSDDGTGFPGTSPSPRPDLTLLPPPLPVAVQRSTPRAASATYTTTSDAGLPVMQRSVVPDAPVDEAPAEEVAPAAEIAETSSPDPDGSEVPVLPAATTEPATSPVGPSPISGTGPAMPLQRAVSAGTPDGADPAVRAGTGPRVGLGAPLTAVPPTAVSSPVQRTADSAPRPLAPPETAIPVSRSVDHSPGQPGTSTSASAGLSVPPSDVPADVPTAGPAGQDQPAAIADTTTAGSPAVPLEPTPAAGPVPLPLQRSADAPADQVPRAASPGADAATSELASGSSSGHSPEAPTHDSSTADHATYDVPLLSAQTPLTASAAASEPGPDSGPSPVASSSGAHPLVVARSAQAPGDTSPSVGRRDAAPSLGQDAATSSSGTPAVDGVDVGSPAAHDVTGPGKHRDHDDSGDSGQAIPEPPVADHAQSLAGLPVVSRSVTALPPASTVLRSTPLPLAAGLATSIQRGSVLLGAGTPATSLVVRPTPVLGARPTGRAVPMQRVLTAPHGVPSAPTSLSTTSMPSTASRQAGPAPSTTLAAAPREPFLRRLQRGVFGPDQGSGPGAPSGEPGPAAGPAGSSANSTGAAQAATPTGIVSSESSGTPSDDTWSDDSWSGDSPSVPPAMPGTSSIPTVARAVATPGLPGVPTVARSATGHAGALAATPVGQAGAVGSAAPLDSHTPLDAEVPGGAGPSLALPPTVQRSMTPDTTLDTPGAAPLPHLALAAPAPPVAQRATDRFPENGGAQDQVQRAVDAGSWGSTEVSLSGPVVQTALEPGTADPAAADPAAAAPAAAAPGAGTPQSPEEIEALAQKLLKPMLRRIKGELLLDRERHGLRTDTW